MHRQVDGIEVDAQRLLKLLGTATAGEAHSGMQAALNDHLLSDLIEPAFDLDRPNHGEHSVDNSESDPRAREALGDPLVRDSGQFHDKALHDDSPFRHTS